jgi:hypothetical protein
MWLRAAVAAVVALCCVVAWGVRADRLTVSGCSQAWTLVYSPCAGGSGPPGGEHISATNPGTLLASASYTQTGTYTNGPPAAIDYSFDGTGCANAAGSPTISGNNISFTNTAPSGSGSHTITLCDHADHSIFGTSTAFTVNGGASCSNSLDFSDGCNSSYLAVVL